MHKINVQKIQKKVLESQPVQDGPVVPEDQQNRENQEDLTVNSHKRHWLLSRRAGISSSNPKSKGNAARVVGLTIMVIVCLLIQNLLLLPLLSM